MDTAQVSKSSGGGTQKTLCESATKVTLPTGETISKSQQLRKVQILGFPATTEPLPAGIETEDIIKQWPNHLVCIFWACIYPIRLASESWAMAWETLSTAMSRDAESFLQTGMLTPKSFPVGTASTADNGSMEPKTKQQSKRGKT